MAGNAPPSPRRRCMFRSAWLHPACLRLSARPYPWQAGAGRRGMAALVPPLPPRRARLCQQPVRAGRLPGAEGCWAGSCLLAEVGRRGSSFRQGRESRAEVSTGGG